MLNKIQQFRQHFTMHDKLNTLQNCKQIPKDDRLILRKHILNNNSDVNNIFTIKDIKKLQIKLRNFVKQLKSNKKQQFYIDSSINPKHAIRIQYKNHNKKELTGVYRLSVEFTNKRNIQLNKKIGRQDLNRTVDNQNRNNIKIYQQNKQIKKQRLSANPSQCRINTQQNIDSSYIHLNISQLLNRQKQVISSKQLQKTQSLYKINQVLQQNNGQTQILFHKNNNQPKLNQQNLYTDPRILQQCRKFIQNCNFKTKQQLKTSPPSFETEKINETKLRHLFLNVSSQTAFDYIFSQKLRVNSQIPSQFIINREAFLNTLKNIVSISKLTFQIQTEQQKENIMTIIFQKDRKFLNFQDVTHFLNNYTINKLNPVRTLYLYIDIYYKGTIDVNEFIALNEWKGQQVVQSFAKLVKKYGKQHKKISYWEMYWAKQSEEFQLFKQLYRHY